MDSRLFMEIGVINTTFQAVDNTPYERWINEGYLDSENSHVVLHRLISIKDGEDNKTIDSKLKVASTLDELRNPFEVEVSNGLYYYQKLIIPTQDHVTTANERLYYNTDDSKLYYVDIDTPDNNFTISNIFGFFDDIYDLVRKGALDNCFYFDDYTLTIYSLIECYVATEQERINNYLRNNCQAGCNGYSDLEARAGILLAAIKVMENLIEKEDYFEAQRILNGLNTCNGLCKKYTNVLKGCGCGTT